MLDYPSEPNLTTGSLSGIGERQRVRTVCDNRRQHSERSEDVMQLSLKMVEGAVN